MAARIEDDFVEPESECGRSALDTQEMAQGDAPDPADPLKTLVRFQWPASLSGLKWGNMNRVVESEHTLAERIWIEAQKDKPMARWLVDYAHAFNTLDISPIQKKLSPWVTYESQSVFDRITGREALLAYWQGKFHSVRQSRHRVAAELGQFPDGLPCVRLFQGADEMDTNWLDAVIAAMTVQVNALGEAERMLMITCVPTPNSTLGSGIYPGLQNMPTTQVRHFVRTSPRFDELTLYAFYLDGQCRLDKAMSESVAQARMELEGIKVVELNVDVLLIKLDPSKLEYHPIWSVVRALRFNGFPSVGVMYQGHPIYRHQGLITGPELVSGINKAAPLYVADPPPKANK